MGGGSADAAAMLRLAPVLAPVSADVLAEIAAALGADVPSQLEPGLVLGTAAGDDVRPAAPRLPHAFVVVPQSAALSTASVYARADELGLPRSGSELDAIRAELVSALESGSELPSRLIVNDLEPAARLLCPPISVALGAVRQAGADHALVCGSGPTVAGLYWGEGGEQRAGVAATSLAERFPGVCLARPVERGFASPVFA
jgi:4-diphosphocytidyl-2-C-methyl-D-erythritol kinase